MLLIADPTPEALTLHLAQGRPWAGVFTDEGGVLIGGAAFNDESRMRTAGLFNLLWDGAPIRRVRVLTGTAFLPGRRCTAHVMMQPVVAQMRQAGAAAPATPATRHRPVARRKLPRPEGQTRARFSPCGW